MNIPATVLGLDIGGSKTQVLLTRDDEVLLDLVLDSANPASVGEEAVSRVLDQVVAAVGIAAPAGDDGPVVPAAVCAGAAGADTEPDRLVLQRLVEERFPGRPVRVVHDTALVLAAEGLTDGVVVISGTGSVAWACHGSTELRAGGWGYLLGDDGGGYGIARQAVRHVLAECDAGQPCGTLSAAVLDHLGLERPGEVLSAFYDQPERARWARLARVVLDLADDGDGPATSIREVALADLTRLAVTVSRRADLRAPVVLAGGLTSHRTFTDSLSRRLHDGGLHDVRVLRAAPAWGAVRLAVQLVDAPSPAHLAALEGP